MPNWRRKARFQQVSDGGGRAEMLFGAAVNLGQFLQRPAIIQFRFEALLESDVENQAGAPVPKGHVPATVMLAKFIADPAAWVASHLQPKQAFCFW